MFQYSLAHKNLTRVAFSGISKPHLKWSIELHSMVILKQPQFQLRIYFYSMTLSITFTMQSQKYHSYSWLQKQCFKVS